jgi:mono/diheme cytochrome c family protein
VAASIAHSTRVAHPSKWARTAPRVLATWLGIIGALASLAALPAFAGERPAKSDTIQPQLIYHNYCSVCHGDRGDGNSRAKGSLVPPPRDFTTATHLTHDTIVRVVTDGRPGTAMVSWKSQLNAAEIDAVATYILSAFVGKPGAEIAASSAISGTAAHGGRERDLAPEPTATADMSLPFPGGLKGDMAKGERFYLGNCATCHGARGDGQGPRAYFIFPKPRSFLAEDSRRLFNRPALLAAVSMGKLGTEMPAWKYVLKEQEMANVAEFVFRRFIRAGSAAGGSAATR